MVGAAGAGGIDQGHPGHAAGIVVGHFQAVHLDGFLLRPEMSREAAGTLGHPLADAFVVGHQVEQRFRHGRVAPAQGKAGIRFGDDAALVQVQRAPDRVGGADRIHAVAGRRSRPGG